MTQQTTKPGAASELAKRLDALWGRAYDICGEFYEDYDRGYAELENEPFECELSSARIRTDGDMITIDYSAAHVYNACTNSCGPYDEEEDADEAYRNCEERCLEEAEKAAKRVFGEYREVVERWAKKRGVKYTEELKRDELNFTLTIRITAEGPGKSDITHP